MLAWSTGIPAILIYSALVIYQCRQWQLNASVRRHWLLGCAALAICLHGISLYPLIDTADGFNLGFFRVSSLIFWVIGITMLISSLKYPVESLLPPLFVCTTISMACALFINSPYHTQNFSYAIALHVLLSILAYSILTIAALQALALGLQDRLLRAKQLQRAMAILPPLQTMEALLFEMLSAGTVLLALSIGSGLLFYEDLKAQHLTHKLLLSLIALCVYGVLLWGRHTQGWRGRTAIRWTLGGFTALMLAYFGTKLVLELILHRL
jgi:ABC-type uncharacterized transport system permease subunit